jgi:hypothetical protein
MDRPGWRDVAAPTQSHPYRRGVFAPADLREDRPVARPSSELSIRCNNELHACRSRVEVGADLMVIIVGDTIEVRRPSS